MLERLNTFLRNDEKIVLAAIQNAPWAYEYASEYLKKERNVAIESIIRCAYVYICLDQDLKKVPFIIRKALIYGCPIKYIPIQYHRRKYIQKCMSKTFLLSVLDETKYETAFNISACGRNEYPIHENTIKDYFRKLGTRKEIFDLMINIPNPQSNNYESSLHLFVSKITESLQPYFQMINMMDLYSIPRVMFNYPSSHMKIYSAGDFHKNVMDQFINLYYPGSLVKSFGSISNEKGPIRCLKTK